MAIPRNIKQYLIENRVSYSHKKHPLAYTSQEIAQIEHIPGGEFAKTLVLQADGQMILAVVPADHTVDLDELKKQVGCSKLSLVPEREFVQKFPASETGAMPPFGKLFGLALYCDSALSKHDEIEFNGGTHIDTIRMKYGSFIKLENPTVTGFSEKSTGRQLDRAA
jgi:Ala-tRNA(Pro) deacylase